MRATPWMPQGRGAGRPARAGGRVVGSGWRRAATTAARDACVCAMCVRMCLCVYVCVCVCMLCVGPRCVVILRRRARAARSRSARVVRGGARAGAHHGGYGNGTMRRGTRRSWGRVEVERGRRVRAAPPHRSLVAAQTTAHRPVVPPLRTGPIDTVRQARAPRGPEGAAAGSRAFGAIRRLHRVIIRSDDGIVAAPRSTRSALIRLPRTASSLQTCRIALTALLRGSPRFGPHACVPRWARHGYCSGDRIGRLHRRARGGNADLLRGKRPSGGERESER